MALGFGGFCAPQFFINRATLASTDSLGLDGLGAGVRRSRMTAEVSGKAVWTLVEALLAASRDLRRNSLERAVTAGDTRARAASAALAAPLM